LSAGSTDSQGQGGRRLQGPRRFDRRRPGARIEGAGQRASEIAKALKIVRASVYWVLAAGLQFRCPTVVGKHGF
jgi:hypothetical protein